MAYKWVFSDVDGCLTSEESVAFENEDFERLSALLRSSNRGAGPFPPMTLCTGRPQPYVEVLMKIFDIRVPAICENGAVLYSLAENHAWYGPGVTREKVHGLRLVREFIESRLLPDHDGALIQFGKEAQISVFSPEPELLPKLIDPIAAYIQEEGLPPLDMKASHYYLNISMDGVTKGSALEWLMNDLGVGSGECAGIGDTTGDIPIREAVGFFGCPSNSQEGLKELADYISPFPEVRGTLDILERIVK